MTAAESVDPRLLDKYQQAEVAAMAAEAAKEAARVTLVEVSTLIPVIDATDDDQAIERAISVLVDDSDLAMPLTFEGKVVER